jgi:hypothetical protein
MTGEPPSSYAVELRPYSDKYSHTTPGEYLEIPIPDEIEKLGFEYGDTVYMDFVSADDASYIRIKFSDTGTRHDLKLKYRDDRYPRYAVTFPTEYTVTRDDSPFQGIGRDETVTVEFNYGSEPEIRIYTEEGYRERTAQLVSEDLTPTIRAPVIGYLLNIFRDKLNIDLTRTTTVRGQVTVKISDQSGNPIKGAKITVQGPSETKAYTDSSGVTTIHRLRKGSYEIEASKDGSTSDIARFSIDYDGNQETVNLKI